MKRTIAPVIMEAAVRNKKTRETKIIIVEHVSNKAFREGLNKNGYTVIGKVFVGEKIMNKYKASFLPTGRSRKMRSLFFYASNDKVAIATVGERVLEQHPDGEVISLQGPDRQFIDLKGE